MDKNKAEVIKQLENTMVELGRWELQIQGVLAIALDYVRSSEDQRAEKTKMFNEHDRQYKPYRNG